MPRRRIKRLDPPRIREKLPGKYVRNPILDNPEALRAWQAEQDSLGVPFIEQMAKLLPSVQDEQAAKAERIRQANEAATAKRLARIAAQNDPDKRERERQRFQARLRATAQSNAARDRRIAAEAEEKARALAENPTLAWRTPRRADWKPPADYATGGRRRNKKKSESAK